MIDLHCHLLPSIDDGAADWDAALKMCRMAAADGITRCAATPHWTGTPGEPERLLERLRELRERLTAEDIDLEVCAGNEVILVPQLLEALQAGRALTLGGTSYLLLETAQLELGAYVDRALFQLQSHGYRIILAHPERVRVWYSRREELRDLLHRGCRLQVNAGSLLGEFGPEARRQAEWLVRSGWVSLLATDAHGPEVRCPRLTPAVRCCARWLGEKAAQAMVDEHPARVLANEELPLIHPESRARRQFRFW